VNLLLKKRIANKLSGVYVNGVSVIFTDMYKLREKLRKIDPLTLA